MQRIVTVALLLFTVGISNAQFSKGTFIVGGSAGYSSASNPAHDKNTTVAIIPQVGYFMVKNLALGIAVNFVSITNKPNGSSTSFPNSNFLFSPFVRYYIPAKLYVQGSYDIGSSKSSPIGANSTSASLSGWTALAGYAILLNDFVALEPQIGYSSLNTKYDSSPKEVSADYFIRIGFQIYLGRK